MIVNDLDARISLRSDAADSAAWRLRRRRLNFADELSPLNRRRIALQIRAIIVPYRVERHRRDSATMAEFRLRARRMMDELEEVAASDPDLAKALAEARAEIDADEA